MNYFPDFNPKAYATATLQKRGLELAQLEQSATSRPSAQRRAELKRIQQVLHERNAGPRPKKKPSAKAGKPKKVVPKELRPALDLDNLSQYSQEEISVELTRLAHAHMEATKQYPVTGRALLVLRNELKRRRQASLAIAVALVPRQVA